MAKFYVEPELNILQYRMTKSVFTESDPGLNDGDDFDLDAINDDAAEVFGIED